MKINDYIRVSEELLYQHKFDRALPPDVYSRHTHNLYELLYFVGGDATCVIEERKYKLHEGDLVLVRPYLHHFIQIDSTTDYERYNVLFDPSRHGVEGVWQIPEELSILHLDADSPAADVFRRMEAYRARLSEEQFFRLLPHLLSELFFSLGSLATSSFETGDVSSPVLAGALRYIGANIFTVRSVSEVARSLFVSESYLCRVFRRELHQSPKRYIRDKRLLIAEKMISLGDSPTTVATQCGFGDYTTFYRNFVAFFGRPPSKR